MAEGEITLSAAEARKLALAAQGLLGPRPIGGPTAMLDRLQAVQLDTISVLARSHELVAYARLGPIGRERIERAYWGPKSATFEYWSHAACILPLEDWPAYGFKRRALAARGHRWHRMEDPERVLRLRPRPDPRRGSPLGPGARRREEGRALVGLVRDQDRRRAAARHR